MLSALVLACAESCVWPPIEPCLKGSFLAEGAEAGWLHQKLGVCGSAIWDVTTWGNEVGMYPAGRHVGFRDPGVNVLGLGLQTRARCKTVGLTQAALPIFH